MTELMTLNDLENLLLEMKASMTVCCNGSLWLAVVSKDGYPVGSGQHKDFVKAVRTACSAAVVHSVRLKDRQLTVS